MRKYGFSLAEVLITLAIIGVIAVLTIPNLNTDINREANAKKFGVVVTAVENALSAGILAEGLHSASDLPVCCDQNSTLCLSKYLVGECAENVITMKNGAILTFSNNNLNIDVNGNKGPNEEFNDIYNVDIEPDGLITATGITSILMQNDYKYTSIKKLLENADNEEKEENED